MLGSSSTPRLLYEHKNLKDDSKVKRFILSDKSQLFEKLCASVDGRCTFPAKVEIDQNVPCFGTECNIDSLRVVEVEAGIFYEYARLPCVQQGFYGSPRLVSSVGTRHQSHCADPRFAAASPLCCQAPNDEGWQPHGETLFESYTGERVHLAEAENRCSQAGLVLCNEMHVRCDPCDKKADRWLARSCRILAKINRDGHVGIIHWAPGVSVPMEVDSQYTNTFFRVDWNGNVRRHLLDDFDRRCTTLGCEIDSADGLCLCATSTQDTVAFDRAPTRQEVLSNLHIGYFDPKLYGQYQETDMGGGVTMYSMDSVISMESIFSVVDNNGIRRFRKNLISTVSIADGRRLSFRNPPHFVSLTQPELLDALYETDAGLDHYFVRHCFDDVLISFF